MTEVTTAPASPEEEPTPQEIAAAGKIRSLDQLPSPWTIKGNPKVLSAPTLEALSPSDREVVRERAGSADPQAVTRALNGFLRERSAEVRIKCGAGEGASETEREALDQMNQMRLFTEEYHRIESELAEVRGHRTEYDANGNAVPVPVYTLQGSIRSAREARLDEIRAQMTAVAGIEGQNALTKAARSDALRIRKRNADAFEQREISRRANAMVQEDRINEAAKTRAKFLRGSEG